LAQVEGSTLIASNGASFEADTIIFSTGFQVADAPIHRRIFGRDGRSLAERWAGCPRAYKGITMSGCPNAFMLLGPTASARHKRFRRRPRRTTSLRPSAPCGTAT